MNKEFALQAPALPNLDLKVDRKALFEGAVASVLDRFTKSRLFGLMGFVDTASRRMQELDEQGEVISRRDFLNPRRLMEELDVDSYAVGYVPLAVIAACASEPPPTPNVPPVESGEPKQLSPDALPVPEPIIWLEVEGVDRCTAAINLLMFAAANMVTGAHVENLTLAVNDPNMVAWPDHVISYLYEHGFTSDQLISTLSLAGCLGSPNEGHNQLQWDWPNSHKNSQNRDKWGEGRGQGGDDGSRYWELRSVKMPPYLHPSPDQKGILESDLPWLSEEMQKSWAIQSQVISIPILAVETAIIAHWFAPGVILAYLPEGVNQLPPDIVDRIVNSLGLNRAGALP